MQQYDIKPELLGFYGLYGDYVYTEEGSIGIKYFKKPDPGFRFDLTMRPVSPDPEDEDDKNDDKEKESEPRRGCWKMRDICIWMGRHPEQIKDEDGNLKIDIVCEMGVYRIILNLPYSHEYNEKIVFKASKYKGIVFIQRMTSREKEPKTGSELAGHLFEHLVTKPLDPNDIARGWLNVMKLKIGNHRTLYSCSVDCVKEKKNFEDIRLSDMVELKTAFRMTRPGQFHRFDMEKSREWWSQVAFSGCEEIYVGIKDKCSFDTCQVCESIEIVETKELPIRGRHHWNPDVCIRYVEKFFNEVTKYVTEDDRNTVHHFVVTPFKITHIPPEEIDLTKHRLFFQTQEVIDAIDSIFK